MSYRIPEWLLEALHVELDEMLEMKIVELSKSEWCSTVVLVPKKDGSLLFCIDFRYLNSVSKFESIWLLESRKSLTVWVKPII